MRKHKFLFQASLVFIWKSRGWGCFMEKMKQAASEEGFYWSKLFQWCLVYAKSLKLSHHLLIGIAYILQAHLVFLSVSYMIIRQNWHNMENNSNKWKCNCKNSVHYYLTDKQVWLDMHSGHTFTKNSLAKKKKEIFLGGENRLTSFSKAIL